MTTYRRRPTQVEAIQVRELRGLIDRPAWIRSAIATRRLVIKPTHIVVRSVHADVDAKLENWIVKDETGELFVMTPAIFEREFERAR